MRWKSDDPARGLHRDNNLDPTRRESKGAQRDTSAAHSPDFIQMFKVPRASTQCTEPEFFDPPTTEPKRAGEQTFSLDSPLKTNKT